MNSCTDELPFPLPKLSRQNVEEKAVLRCSKHYNIVYPNLLNISLKKSLFAFLSSFFLSASSRIIFFTVKAMILVLLYQCAFLENGVPSYAVVCHFIFIDTYWLSKFIFLTMEENIDKAVPFQGYVKSYI